MSTPIFLAIDASGAAPGTLGSILYSGPDFQAAEARADSRRQQFRDSEDAPVDVFELKRVER